jgi:toxin ParE1/3/4
MSQSRIVLSLDAERDLDELFDCIARDNGVGRAEAILGRIDEALQRIAATPRIGRIRRDLDGGPRTFAVSPWVVVYEPLSAGQGIVVWRVIDGRRDLPRHIRR